MVANQTVNPFIPLVGFQTDGAMGVCPIILMNCFSGFSSFSSASATAFSAFVVVVVSSGSVQPPLLAPVEVLLLQSMNFSDLLEVHGVVVAWNVIHRNSCRHDVHFIQHFCWYHWSINHEGHVISMMLAHCACRVNGICLFPNKMIVGLPWPEQWDATLLCIHFVV